MCRRAGYRWGQNLTLASVRLVGMLEHLGLFRVPTVKVKTSVRYNFIIEH
jgi:hypothetical protein